MNYEDFSPEAQKVIDQFRNLIENIKFGKDNAKICYWGRVNISPMIYEADRFHARYSNMNTIMESYCFVARIPLLEGGEIRSFIQNKYYFLPKFSSYEDLEQNKHKYLYIKE